MISDPQHLDDSPKRGSCVLTLADAAEPDTVSGLHRGSLSSSSASISNVFRNGLENLKRTSIGIFGVSLRMRKQGNVHVETVDEILANRYAKSPEIGAMDILKKTELDFQADMATFVQIINENCLPTENTIQLLELVACMQQTSGVISESHSNIKSEWPWKNTAAIYNKFYGLLTSFAKTESELFFKSKNSGLRLDKALLQRMNEFLFKILERPIWLRFFLHTASVHTEYKDSEYLNYALVQMATLVSAALDLAGIDASFDGYTDMISLEKNIDSSKCLGLEADPYADARKHSKKRGGRATLGEPLTILCAGDFILIGRDDETASGKRSVFRLLYVPAALKSIIARQYDVYGSLENVIEMNLCNSVLIAVQTRDAEDRQLLASFLNGAEKQPNGVPMTPSFWLVDKPPVETAAILYTAPAAQPQESKPRVQVFQCLCYPHISRDGSWEKLAKCEFLIVTEWDGANPRIVVSLDGTMRQIATMDVHVDTDMRMAGSRGVTLLMKTLNTGTFAPYMVNVKDANVRDELLQSVEKIKANLTSCNFNAMADKLVLKNIPDYIQLCKDLEAQTLWFDCIVNVKITSDGSSKIHQLGLSKLCLKTLPSPVGQFKIATLTSESNVALVYLDALVTSDLLVQDCRKPSCTLIKIYFASKPGVEYNLEFVSEKPKEVALFSKSPSTDAKKKVALHTIVSELILSFLRKGIPAHECMFRAPEPAARSDPPIIKSASSETVAETPSKIQRPSQTTNTMPAKKTGPRVGGWVASQVRFFNGLAQRSPVTSDSTDGKAKVPKKKLYLSAKSASNFSLKEAALAPSVPASASASASSSSLSAASLSASSSAPGLSATASSPSSSSASLPLPALRTSSINTTVQEAEKWVKFFSDPQKVEKDDGKIILPPSGSPEELLSSWLFIPRVAKKIITSGGGSYDQMLFFVAVTFLEIDSRRKLKLAGGAF
ncbi:hypothetical protein HDU81_008406 [Chytriomyces hyalinus]|nr:hypothetical protein HDU81_008406 [Chytriomyces hyalinus]